MSPKKAAKAEERTPTAAAEQIINFCSKQEGGVVKQEVLEEQMGKVLAPDLFLAGLNRLMSCGSKDGDVGNYWQVSAATV